MPLQHISKIFNYWLPHAQEKLDILFFIPVYVVC